MQTFLALNTSKQKLITEKGFRNYVGHIIIVV